VHRRDRLRKPNATARLTRARTEHERLADRAVDQLAPTTGITTANSSDVVVHHVLDRAISGHRATVAICTLLRARTPAASSQMSGIAPPERPGTPGDGATATVPVSTSQSARAVVADPGTWAAADLGAVSRDVQATCRRTQPNWHRDR